MANRNVSLFATYTELDTNYRSYNNDVNPLVVAGQVIQPDQIPCITLFNKRSTVIGFSVSLSIYINNDSGFSYPLPPGTYFECQIYKADNIRAPLQSILASSYQLPLPNTIPTNNLTRGLVENLSIPFEANSVMVPVFRSNYDFSLFRIYMSWSAQVIEER